LALSALIVIVLGVTRHDRAITKGTGFLWIVISDPSDKE
jgi:hypothetical protein